MSNPYNWPILPPKRPRRHRLRRLWLAVLALLGLGCYSDPLSMEGRRAATPEEVARNAAWYQQVSTCLELPGAVDRVRWWYVLTMRLVGYDNVLGATRGDDIWIIPSTPPPGQPMRGAVHLHESMHHILGHDLGDPDGGHTHSLWSVCPRVPDIEDDDTFTQTEA